VYFILIFSIIVFNWILHRFHTNFLNFINTSYIVKIYHTYVINSVSQTNKYIPKQNTLNIVCHIFSINLRELCTHLRDAKGIRSACVIVDNARVHRRADLEAITSEYDFELKYLAPYSYMLNPIETVFCKAKNLVKQIVWSRLDGTLADFILQGVQALHLVTVQDIFTIWQVTLLMLRLVFLMFINTVDSAYKNAPGTVNRHSYTRSTPICGVRLIMGHIMGHINAIPISGVFLYPIFLYAESTVNGVFINFLYQNYYFDPKSKFKFLKLK